MEKIERSDSKWLNVSVDFRAFTFKLSFLKVQPYDTNFYKQTIACAEIPLYFERPFQNDDILHFIRFSADVFVYRRLLQKELLNIPETWY